MATQTLFIVKLLTISAVLSVAIKYIAPSFAILPTATNALIAVLSPTIAIAIAFLVRYTTVSQQKTN